MGLFNDAYEAVAEAILTVGKHDRAPYYYKPSAKAQKIQVQLEKYGTVKIVEILGALNEATQQNLIAVDRKLMSVEAPEWLHINEKAHSCHRSTAVVREARLTPPRQTATSSSSGSTFKPVVRQSFRGPALRTATPCGFCRR